MRCSCCDVILKTKDFDIDDSGEFCSKCFEEILDCINDFEENDG